MEKQSILPKVTASRSVAELRFEPRDLASESLVIMTFLHGLFQRNEG